MTDENGNEIPASVKPWANLITMYGLPCVLLCAILVCGYLGVYRITNWVAPKIDTFIQEHTELKNAIIQANVKVNESNIQHAKNNEQLIEVQRNQTLIMGSIDKHLESTDKRLEHIEQNTTELKSGVTAIKSNTHNDKN